MFLRNAWYMAGWATDLKPGQILARTICNDPIALFRDAKGDPTGLEDRCRHRHYPLSASGEVIAGNIQCGYHGTQFDPSGKCIKIPSQSHIPENARVRNYAVVERHRCLWIWMGDAARADRAAIPKLEFLDDPAWGWRSTLYHTKANYKFIIENLLDLTHLAFVHKSTIGNAAVVEIAETKTVHGDHDVQVNRWVINAEAPPTYAKVAGFKTNIDRWQLIRYVPPALVYLWTGGAAHGMNAREKIGRYGAPDGGKLGGIGLINLNLMTPETETSTLYFWAQGQDRAPQDQGLTDLLFEQVEIAFKQDLLVFEQQQIRTNQAPDAPRINISGDAGGVHAVKILNQAIEAEQRAL